MAVFFGGQLLVTPVTASVVNDDAMQNQNLTVGNAAVFVGKSTGGEPKKVLSFGSPQDAKSVLRSGELLDAVIKAFDPSAETGAPSTVYAVRVNPATRATLVLEGNASEELITLSANNWGLADNQIKVKVEAGSVSGKRVTVQLGSDIYIGDNLGRAAFSVLYGGGEGTSTISIAAGTVTLVEGALDPVVISLSEFETVSALVDRINSIGPYTAEVQGGNENHPTYNSLDFVSVQDITSEYTVRADLQAVVDWFNSQAQPLVSAVREDNVGATLGNINFTYLTGGAEGTTANQDWSDSFTALQLADVQWVTPISGEADIHAMADTHAAFCSTILRKERRVVCGTASGTSDADAIAAAAAINSDRTSLVHLGYYDYNTAGKLVLFPPYMSAAIISAAFAGSNPGTPLTNKSIKIRGLERELRNPTDTDALINGGVLALESTEQGYKVVKSISTWLIDDRYNRVEQSTGAALDFTVRNVRNAVDVLRGQKANPLLLSRARSITESTLRELARPEPQGPGVLAGDEANPAYRNINASIEGDVVRIEFECSPVIPANYVLVTVFAVPYSSAAA